MVEALVISNIVLWLIVVMLALLVFALTRQIGILHERVAPAGALQPTSGPKVGELTTEISLTALDGSKHRIGGTEGNGLASFILFISPTCPVCKSLVPTAISLAKSEANRMQLLFGSDGEEIDQHKQYVKDLKIEDYPYFVSQALGMTYQVSKLPFAVLIGADGTLQSKGLVNTREHLESLIESMDSGIATVQEYVNAQLDSDDSEYTASAVEQHS
ncbi:MAG: thiol-disulfide isomerase [Pseudomonadales bacterium]|nr:thiol-disulfide isomerase [Pseudomonadales bacterium]